MENNITGISIRKGFAHWRQSNWPALHSLPIPQVSCSANNGLYNPDDGQCRSGSADDSGNVADYVIESLHPASISYDQNGVLRTVNLSCRHGVKGRFNSSGRSISNKIPVNTITRTTRRPTVHGTPMRMPFKAIEKIAANTNVITAMLIYSIL